MNIKRVFMVYILAFSCMFQCNIVTAKTPEPAIFVSIKPFYNLMLSVLGHERNTTLLLQGQASTHDYTLKPSDVKAINQADFIIWGGENLEPYLKKTIANLSNKYILDLSKIEDLQLLPMQNNQEDHHHEKHNHKHHHTDNKHEHCHHHGFDPHFWLSTDNASKIIQAIYEGLSQLTPVQEKHHYQNKMKAQKNIQQLHIKIKQMLATQKSTPYLVFHDAYQYFEKEFSLRPANSLTIHPEIPVSIRKLKEVTEQILEKDIQCIFSEPQFNRKTIQMLIDTNPNLSHGTLDPIGADQDIGPNGYTQMMSQLAQNIYSCMQQSTHAPN